MDKDVVVTSQKLTFQQAQSFCRNKGYELLRIDNDRFNILIYNLAVKYQVGRYWIDANDIQTEGTFVYSDGRRIAYSKFPKGEPNNYQNEDCVNGLYYRDGWWNDIKCNDPNAVICSRNIASSISTSYVVTAANRKLYISREQVIFTQAQTLCKNKGYQLLQITDDNFNTIIYNLGLKYQTGPYWIDANDQQSEGTFVYSDGRRITYHKFPRGEPNNDRNEDCVHGLYYGNGFWNDVKCDDKNAVICFQELAPQIEKTLNIGYKQLIILKEKTIYERAVLQCKALGYNLIKIEDDQFNTALYNLALEYKFGRYWIDTNDIQTEGTFIHQDGNKPKYSKFAPGEPNNNQNEDCVHGMFYRYAQWNDIRCDDSNTVICYKDTEPAKIQSRQLLNKEIIILQERTTYSRALTLCKDQGYKLIKIDDDQLNTMVYNLATQTRIGRYWIDLNDIQVEGSFVDSDGKRMVYHKFPYGEPNNYQDEDCIHGWYYADGYWNDISCNDHNSVICYKEIQVESLTRITVSNREIVFLQEKSTYDRARSLCKDQGYELLQIKDDEFNVLIYNLAVQYKIGRYWIDVNDIRLEGYFEDSQSNRISYSKFPYGEPNNYNNEDCVHGLYYTNGFWNDISCFDKNAVICYKETGSHGLTKLEITNNEIVIFEEKIGYHEAADLCKSKGYHIIRIDNDETNMMVYDLALKHKIGTYWIDANDMRTEGTFVNSDEKRISYQKFAPGEPNNYGNEDCVHGLYYRNGLWNDIRCDYKNAVICSKSTNSIEPITKKWEGKYHIHTVLVTYEEAINFCNKHHCRIVEIDNESTNQIIYEFARKSKIGTFWINGNDIVTEGLWVNTNGKRLEYFNWERGEPNNYRNEDCLHGNYYPNGKWNDISCYTRNYLIYEYESSAEIEITLEIINEKVNYEKALALCKDNGYSLVRIENEEINNLVYKLAVKEKIGDYWIDANDRKTEKNFVYSYGPNISYSNFPRQSSNFNDNKDCVQGLYNSNGRWNEVDCHSINSVICFKEYRERKKLPDKSKIEIDSSKYFVHTGKVTYEEALIYCHVHNCRLVTVTNAELDRFLLNLARRYRIREYWLDGNDLEKEGLWVNIDGKKLNYLNWHAGEPNNYQIEDCLEGNYYPDGKWNDISCLTKNAFIYYYEENTVSQTEIEIFREKVTFGEAQNLCKKRGFSLIRIDNEETNQRIYDLAVKNKIGPYWIDANDRNIEGRFVDSHGNVLQYSKFPKGEPNNYQNEDCVHGLHYSNGFWNDISCYSKNSFICMKHTPGITFIDEHTSYQIFIDKTTYKLAVDLCKAEGYSLIQIDNIEDSQYIHQLSMKYKLPSYWIDGTDSQNEGTWLYSDGETMKYKNWAHDITSNKDKNCIYSNPNTLGKWIDVSCNSQHSVICYKDSKEFNKEKYIIKPKYHFHEIGVTFKEALEFCKDIKCQLVIVDNIDTNKYLLEFAKELKFSKYWLNGNDRDNEGTWVDTWGYKLIYFNWAAGEPKTKNNLNCLVGNSQLGGAWNGISCEEKHPFFFEYLDEDELCDSD